MLLDISIMGSPRCLKTLNLIQYEMSLILVVLVSIACQLKRVGDISSMGEFKAVLKYWLHQHAMNKMLHIGVRFILLEPFEQLVPHCGIFKFSKIS